MDGLAGRISQAAVSPCRCADSRPDATPDRPQQLLRHQHPRARRSSRDLARDAARRRPDWPAIRRRRTRTLVTGPPLAHR